jgi:hypothetical protein
LALEYDKLLALNGMSTTFKINNEEMPAPLEEATSAGNGA